MFLRLSSTSQTINHFNFKPREGVLLRLSHDKSATLLSSPIIVPLVGATAGEHQTDTKLQANKSYQLIFGEATVKNPGLLTPSAELAALPIIISATPALVYSQTFQTISLTVQPVKTIDLSTIVDVACLIALQRV